MAKNQSQSYEGKSLQYAGAKGKAHKAQLSRYLLQPKVDGAYGEVSTDNLGNVVDLRLRSGKSLTGKLRADYQGLNLGAPNSVFACEIEAFTEAANRHAQMRGYRNLYLFDLISIDGSSLAMSPYSERYQWLTRIQACAQGESPDRLPEDTSGRLHDALGRFARDVPLAHRRYEILPLVSSDNLESCWTKWVTYEKLGPAEGLVAINPNSKLGVRGSKLKLKRAETLDCVVEDASSTRAIVTYSGGTFTVGCKGLKLTPGMMVEIAFDGGFYERSMIPRFPRIVRERPDLSF